MGDAIVISSDKKGACKITFEKGNYFWGSPATAFYAEGTSAGNGFFAIALDISPELLKSFIDKSGYSKNNPLYYYHIRKSVTNDIILAVNNLSTVREAGYYLRLAKRDNRKISCSIQGIAKNILGMDIEEDEIKSILHEYGYKTANGLLEIPFWRFDIYNEQEVAADLLRYCLAHKGDSIFENCNIALNKKITNDYYFINSIRVMLSGTWYTEIISNPFITEQDFKWINRGYMNNFDPLCLLNPIKRTHNIFAPSLIPIMKDLVDKNNRLFEISKVKHRSLDGQHTIVERDVVCLGDYCKYDSMGNFFNLVYSFMGPSLDNLRMDYMPIDENSWFWSITRNDTIFGAIYFNIINTDYAKAVFECDICQLRELAKTDVTLASPLADDDLFREYSVDLQPDIPFIELLKIMSKADNYKLIKNCSLENVNVYEKGSCRYLNYVIKITFRSCLKKDIRDFNIRFQDLKEQLMQDYNRCVADRPVFKHFKEQLNN